MPIQFKCPSCSQPIEVDDDHAQTQVICYYCSNVITVPDASTLTVQDLNGLPADVPGWFYRCSGSTCWFISGRLRKANPGETCNSLRSGLCGYNDDNLACSRADLTARSYGQSQSYLSAAVRPDAGTYRPVGKDACNGFQQYSNTDSGSCRKHQRA